MFNYFLFSFFISYLLFFISKKFKFAQDYDFNKPQAIHNNIAFRILGLPIIPIFIYLYFNNFFDEDLVYYNFFFYAFICSFIGLLDDFGFKINPYYRFFYQILIVSLIFIFSEPISLLPIFNFLPSFFANNYFMFFFTIIAILTIANAFNFIDGCNGLVILYTISILSYLFLINNISEYSSLFLVLIIFLFTILTLNFPISRAFLGDFGSYFFGFFISFLLIYISNSNFLSYNNINEWLIAILLVYPSFEIFSSVLRRLLNKQSPFYPDNSHLHSMIYRLLKFKFDNLKSNYLTTLIILAINLLIFLITFFVSPNLYYLFFFIFFKLLFVVRYYISFNLGRRLLEK